MEEGASVTPAKRKGGKSEPRTPRCNSGKKRHFINFCFGRNKGDDESDEEDEAPCSSGAGSTVGDAGGHSGLTPAMGAMDVEQCTHFVAWAAGGALGAVAVQCCLVRGGRWLRGRMPGTTKDLFLAILIVANFCFF